MRNRRPPDGPPGSARFSAPFLLGALLALAGTWGGGAAAAAQERAPAPSLVPDRPGLGDGTHVLAPGVFQAELGVELADRGAATEVSLGQTVLRYGAGSLELRALVNSFVIRRNGTDDQGFQDLAAGVKLGLAEDADGRYRLSGLGTLSMPTGSAGFGGDEAVGGVTALAEWTPAGAGVTVAGNLGVSVPLESGVPAWTVIVTPAWSIDAVDGLGAYAGWAGVFVDGADENWLEGGLTYLVDSEAQVDLNAGWSPDRDDLFVGLGLARRVR